MAQWNPEYRILIDSQNLTNISLVGLTIQSGRTNIFNQPQAGYCSVQLLNLDNAFYDITVNSSVTVEIKKSDNTWLPLFGGRISDVSTVLNSAGSTNYVTKIDIIAIGAISKLYKAIWQDALAQDFDGDQIYAILGGFFVNSWNEVSPALQWSTYNSTETWVNAQNSGLGEIDQPGQYEMEQRSADPTEIYSLVTQIANSALGYIYENAQGQIGYADAAHRGLYLNTNGYSVLDANFAFSNGIRSTISNGNIVNQYVLNYGNNFNNQEIASDADSIAYYGLYAANFNSNIHDATDAENVAQRQIDLRAYPRPFFDQITFPLQNPEIDTNTRDTLLAVFMGLPIKIINLPPVFNGGEFTGFVEGWAFRSTVNGLQLTLTVSPTEFSTVAQTWSKVNGAETWNSILNTLEWQDAIGVIS